MAKDARDQRPPQAPPEPEATAAEERLENVYVHSPFKRGPKGSAFNQIGDVLSISHKDYAELSALGLVGRERPLDPEEIRMPEGRPETVRAKLLGGMKRNGKHLRGGELVDLPFDEFKTLAHQKLVELAS